MPQCQLKKSSMQLQCFSETEWRNFRWSVLSIQPECAEPLSCLTLIKHQTRKSCEIASEEKSQCHPARFVCSVETLDAMEENWMSTNMFESIQNNNMQKSHHSPRVIPRFGAGGLLEDQDFLTFSCSLPQSSLSTTTTAATVRFVVQCLGNQSSSLLSALSVSLRVTTQLPAKTVLSRGSWMHDPHIFIALGSVPSQSIFTPHSV